MKIIVLAGRQAQNVMYLSLPELESARPLEKGHQAFLLDVFMGLPYDLEKLSEVFDLPGHGLEIADGIKNDRTGP